MQSIVIVISFIINMLIQINYMFSYNSFINVSGLYLLKILEDIAVTHHKSIHNIKLSILIYYFFCVDKVDYNRVDEWSSIALSKAVAHSSGIL